MIKKMITLKNIILTEGYLGLCRVIAEYKRYDYPLQFIRKPFENYYLNTKIKNYINFDPEKKIFTDVQIETQNVCNYKCPFCPNSRFNVERKEMSIELFMKIINELKEINYSGWIKPFVRGEPYLDARFIDWLKIIDEQLPNAKVRVESNGSVLTEEKFHETLNSKNVYLTINDYTPDNKVMKKINEFNISDPERKKLIIADRKINVTLTNRSGNLNETKFKLPLNNFCNRPFEKIYIHADGKCIICCNDWKGESVVGDVNINRLQDIWKDKILNIYREKLINKNREIGICAQCDFMGYQKNEED